MLLYALAALAPLSVDAAITQTGSVLEYNISDANSGTAATDITVPSDAELIVVGISGWDPTVNYFSGGSMTFTKDGGDTAMVSPTSAGDSDVGSFLAAMFYQALPDTGTNKTLKWDWAGASVANDAPKIAITFWKGIDTDSPVRDADGVQASSLDDVSTPTLTAESGDLIVVWVGAFNGSEPTEATIDGWINATELAEVSTYDVSDGAWATASPAGNQTVGVDTYTNFEDGGIVAVVFKEGAENPDPPTGLMSSPTSGGVNLVWAAPAGSPDTYGIWRSTSAFTMEDEATLIASINAASTNYTDTAVTRGISYYFRVTATNETATSTLSNMVHSGSNSGRIIRLGGTTL